MNEQDKKDLIEYIYDFAWQYARYYQVGNDADEIIKLIQQKIELPESVIEKIMENGKIF